MKIVFSFICLFVFFLTKLSSQNIQFLHSKVDKKHILGQLSNVSNTNYAPIHSGIFRANERITDVSAKIINATFVTVESIYLEKIDMNELSDSIIVNTRILTEQKKNIVEYAFNPIQKNPQTGIIEILDDFTIEISYFSLKKKELSLVSYAENSILSTGDWYKIKIDTTGIFKLTYNQLVQIGINEPKNIRIYGNGGKQLSYYNAPTMITDLTEIPVYMEMGTDNEFNSGDYILFYTQGPITWDYNKTQGMFFQSYHNYSNYTYVFLTSDLGSGRKISTKNENDRSVTESTNSYDSYRFHEVDNFNLIRSGRTWYGEKMRPETSLNLTFDFPNLITTEALNIYTDVAARREANSPFCFFRFYQNSELINTINVFEHYGNYLYANDYYSKFVTHTNEPKLQITISFLGGNSTSEGYINFLTVNAREKLAFQGDQLQFRDIKTVGSGNVTRFTIESAVNLPKIWDVTDPVNYFAVSTQESESETKFVAGTDSLRSFVAFQPENTFTPIIEGTGIGKIENQNLHGEGQQDMVIVTHPDFLSYAEELAQWHRDQDNLSVFVTTPEKIYNEFSSGTPEVSAIRNFMRMLYDKASADENLPKYLLLFGDGSYDNRTESLTNSNLIPTYQSTNSLIETASYVSDDFFGLLDVNEGEYLGVMDIGIGRFPVQTKEEAQLMLDKIYQYSLNNDSGEWQTKVCFIADDDDGGAYMDDSEELSDIIDNLKAEFNVNKIYFDAYEQISTPSGQRFPDVTKVINDQVNQGALIIDYVGHGNPRILAHEEVLSVSDVQDWINWKKLAVFVTASCEVGRFDDYARTSLGEWMVLNPKGGGIAALTTTRVVTSGANQDLNSNFIEAVFNPGYRLGDVIRVAKANTSGDTNKRNFSLLGDPALMLTIPKNKVVKNPKLDSNDLEILDTINALEKTAISGYILDSENTILNVTGTVYFTVYDKQDTITTFGQDNSPFSYTLQDKILFRGKSSVANGFFQSEFILPKDINYKYGAGKISFFAKLDSTEAIGFSKDIIIGGNSENTETDNTGPAIQLYMNDTTFVTGGTTDQNPVLLAILTDEFGINTTGIGFGHNIIAVLDNNQENVMTLNNYYEGAMDQYNKGSVYYPLSNLEEGYHTLYFKSWDIYNNSSDATIEFYVKNNSNPELAELFNYPNPFSDVTNFIFNHNLASQELHITIDIYDLVGQKVTSVEKTLIPEGYQIEPITWYGTNASGAKIPNGLYIYHVKVSTKEGIETTKSSKLMIFR